MNLTKLGNAKHPTNMIRRAKLQSDAEKPCRRRRRRRSDAMLTVKSDWRSSERGQGDRSIETYAHIFVRDVMTKWPTQSRMRPHEREPQNNVWETWAADASNKSTDDVQKMNSTKRCTIVAPGISARPTQRSTVVRRRCEAVAMSEHEADSRHGAVTPFCVAG